MASRKRSRAERAVPLPSDWVPPPMPSERGLLCAVVTQMFDELEVSVAVWLYASWWQAIHVHSPHFQQLESELGVSTARFEHNDLCLKRAARSQRPVIGEFRGLCSVFLPVSTGLKPPGVIVMGPFARTRPSSAEIHQRWLEMTGSQGRLSDPAFYRFVSLTLSVLTLDAPLVASFKRLMQLFATLISGKGDPEALGAEAQRRRQELFAARFVERMWSTTRTLTGEQKMDSGVAEHGLLAPFGIQSIPRGVAVGLFSSLRANPDPLDERVRTDAYLRACVALARRRGGVLIGPVGHNGVVMLAEVEAGNARATLVDLGSRAATLARRFGFALHVGIADTGGNEPVPARYLAALRAAERALSENKGVIRSEPLARPTLSRLRALRSALGRSVEQGPSVISARFEEYVQAVLAHSGYRMEQVRSHLDAGFERLVEPIGSDGLLDEKSLSDLWAAIERATDGARTVAALTDAYRRIVSDLGRGLQSPTSARRERSMRRALSFIREHLGEPLPLERVARAAGFAPKYFSELFHKSEGMTYATCVRDMRLSRARDMLKLSRLTVDRVGRACGFRTRTHFHRSFRQAYGITPMVYRTSEATQSSRRARPHASPAASSKPGAKTARRGSRMASEPANQDA